MSLSKRPRSDSSDSDADAAGRRAAQKLRVDAGALVTTKITENGRNPLLDLLFEPNRYGKTCERICSLAGLSNTLKLRQVCKKASGLHRYLWDVNHCLSRFVKDQKAFRSQMGKHDVLISGSFALQFFERVFWKDSDLDVFVKRGQGAEAFGSYLCEKEGYKLLDVKDQDVYAMRDLTEVWSRSLWLERSTRVVRLSGCSDGLILMLPSNHYIRSQTLRTCGALPKNIVVIDRMADHQVV